LRPSSSSAAFMPRALRAASLSLELPSGYRHRLDAMLIGGHLRSLTLFPQ
jgi:hypothetical protein